MSLVDQYYPQIYKFLVSELDPNAVCVMSGVCPNSEEVEVKNNKLIHFDQIFFGMGFYVFVIIGRANVGHGSTRNRS